MFLYSANFFFRCHSIANAALYEHEKLLIANLDELKEMREHASADLSHSAESAIARLETISIKYSIAMANAAQENNFVSASADEIVRSWHSLKMSS